MHSVQFQPAKSARFADAALKKSVRAMEQAQQCAVLWFGDIMRRRLYRRLGYSSINQYAQVELKFSKTRTGDFVQLARKLDDLPAVREAIANGEVGYTKAREIVKVASPENEAGWVAEAKENSRRELARKVAVAKERARQKPDPGQAELMPVEIPIDTPAAVVPVRLALEMSPEQFARYEALLEKLHKQGAGKDRVEMVLEAMAALVEDRQKAPRGALPGNPPYQIHIHQCPDCGRGSVATSKGELAVAKDFAESVGCDAGVLRPGERNTATIPPTTRRLVLARDRHRCQAPGCDHVKFLEVHHVVPRARGGQNGPENLITLCSACHRLQHERPGAVCRA